MNNQASVAEIKAQCKQWLESGQMQIAHAEVRAMRNDRTHEIEVRGQFCCAPDEHTILLYPVSVHQWGYWNKGTIRKKMAEVKRELLAQMAADGYMLRHLAEGRVEMCEIRF